MSVSMEESAMFSSNRLAVLTMVISSYWYYSRRYFWIKVDSACLMSCFGFTVEEEAVKAVVLA